MDILNQTAIAVFYGSADSGTYTRAGGFSGLGMKPKEKKYNGTITLTYDYSASEVTVNPWDAPWGKSYPGDPNWAFDTGFVHGLHGGPRPSHMGWTWNGVTQTDSPFDFIVNSIDETIS